MASSVIPALPLLDCSEQTTVVPKKCAIAQVETLPKLLIFDQSLDNCNVSDRLSKEASMLSQIFHSYHCTNKPEEPHVEVDNIHVFGDNEVNNNFNNVGAGRDVAFLKSATESYPTDQTFCVIVTEPGDLQVVPSLGGDYNSSTIYSVVTQVQDSKIGDYIGTVGTDGNPRTQETTEDLKEIDEQSAQINTAAVVCGNLKYNELSKPIIDSNPSGEAPILEELASRNTLCQTQTVKLNGSSAVPWQTETQTENVEFHQNESGVILNAENEADFQKIRELFGESLEVQVDDYVQQEITLEGSDQYLEESGYSSTTPSSSQSSSDPDDLSNPDSPGTFIPSPRLIPTSVESQCLTSGDESSDTTDGEEMEYDDDPNYSDAEVQKNEFRKLRRVPASTLNKRRRPSRRKCPQIWQFLLNVLGDGQYNPNIVRWEDKSKGIFKITKSKVIAQLWGRMRRPDKDKEMTYEHFSRALRYYYARDVIYSVPKKRLTYQFGPNAVGWKAFSRTHSI